MDAVDPSVLAALEQALESTPDNLALRLHLVGLLLQAGDARRALTLCQDALVTNPAHPELLHSAARSARAAGDETLAGAYEALAGTAAPTVALGAAEGPAPTGKDLALDAELDALLANAAEDAVDIDAASVTLADVGGMDDVKKQIERSFLAPMRNPELRKLYGKSLRGGLLLYGPPGCGKTFLARAIAGELGASFFAVGLHDVLDMWLGQSEQNLHAVFERARRNMPCVLFLDEVDALGQKRSNLARSAGRNVVVQLLAELDSIDTDNEGLFVLGATNQPWDVDPALRRPGRFDRTVLVLPPDGPARAKILEVHLRDRPVEGVDVRALAARTDGFSGADLRFVCETAAELAIEESLSSGRVRPIGMPDLLRAISGTPQSVRAWLDIARNFVTFANATGEYDELYQYLKRQKLV